MSWTARGLAACVLIGAAVSAPSACAAVERLDGLVLDLPTGWVLEDAAASRRRALERGWDERGGSLVAAWHRGLPQGGDARLVLARCAASVDLSACGLDRARELLAEGVGACAPQAARRVAGALFTSLGGAPAYRFHLRELRDGEGTEEIVYIFGDEATYILVFSCPARAFRSLESEIDSIALGSERDMQPSFCRLAASWIWALIIFTFLGGGAAASRGRN